MSASAHAGAIKYESRVSLEKTGHGLRVGTPMSGAEFPGVKEVKAESDGVFHPKLRLQLYKAPALAYFYEIASSTLDEPSLHIVERLESSVIQSSCDSTPWLYAEILQPMCRLSHML
ncbi:hypothetical protein EVAR_63182_1 [Eumeta japonica]|uniref:Uncharacterized protein n=1 Tax=Eumeta variegata TaxID=151549 RepID=A0A4C1ZZH9_EUMVA|nr:hypothetical protein EVAR_63182_1 [Eumeta japonica]